MKKYKLWWLLCTFLAAYIGANWVLFALTGVSFITTSNHNQFVAQILIGCASIGISFAGYVTGDCLK